MPNFFAIFKLYCSASGTFFTPVGKLGLALHKMWEVSNLLMSSMMYGEYFSCTMKLEQMEKDNPDMFETYRVICHFYICMDVHNARENVNGMKVWADYLFHALDDAP